MHTVGFTMIYVLSVTVHFTYITSWNLTRCEIFWSPTGRWGPWNPRVVFFFAFWLCASACALVVLLGLVMSCIYHVLVCHASVFSCSSGSWCMFSRVPMDRRWCLHFMSVWSWHHVICLLSPMFWPDFIFCAWPKKRFGGKSVSEPLEKTFKQANGKAWCVRLFSFFLPALQSRQLHL